MGHQNVIFPNKSPQSDGRELWEDRENNKNKSSHPAPALARQIKASWNENLNQRFSIKKKARKCLKLKRHSKFLSKRQWMT